jgi:hypothetical protein
LSFFPRFWFMVFNATFNNISVISWRSVLLVEETGVPGEDHRKSLTKGFVLTTLVVIGTDCKGGCKSNYHMITTSTAPSNLSCTNVDRLYQIFLVRMSIGCTRSIFQINFTSLVVCRNTISSFDFPTVLTDF